jgi:hypothetical protein
MSEENEKIHPIHVESDREFWGIVSAMPDKSYVLLENLSHGYTKVLYYDHG